MSYSTKFWNRTAKKYAATPVPNEEIYQKKLQETQKYLEQDMNVLEFGCGTGSTALVHSPLVKSYTAIDSSEKMLEIARSKLHATDIDNLQFEVLSIEDLDINKNQFDMVLGLSILHLLEDPNAAIQKTNKLLRSGGYFVSSSACIMDFMPWFRFITPLLSFLSIIPKVTFFSHSELIEMLESNGFEILFELERESQKEACFIIAKKIQ